VQFLRREVENVEVQNGEVGEFSRFQRSRFSIQMVDPGGAVSVGIQDLFEAELL
jgi:hypothetical protein